jgi:hypothetical protein
VRSVSRVGVHRRTVRSGVAPRLMPGFVCRRPRGAATGRPQAS